MVRKELLEDFVISNIVKLLSEKEVKDKMIFSYENAGRFDNG